MAGVQITLPAELIEATGMDTAGAAKKSAMLLALELLRENRISLGRAAELCEMPLEAFMIFAGAHGVHLNYTAHDLEQDRRTLERLSS